MIILFHKNYKDFFVWLRRTYPWFYQFTQKKEWSVTVFFGFLLFILLIRLFVLQIIEFKDFDTKLASNHDTTTRLQAQRGDIFVTDSSSAPLKLTENVTLYNVFVDPKFVKDKKRFITLMTPLIYVHLCQINGFSKPDKKQCIDNIESFSKTEILPQSPEVIYYGSWIISPEYYTFDRTGYNQKYQTVLSGFTTWQAYDLISQRLDSTILIGKRKYNYIWYITDTDLLTTLSNLNRPYIHIFYKHYVFIEPWNMWSMSIASATKELAKLFDSRGFDTITDTLADKFVSREYRYLKLMSDAHPTIVDALNKLKTMYYKDRVDGIPLLHGVWTESYIQRYYPYKNFMSHVIGYFTKDGAAHYGIEEYFDDILKWVDWKLEWRSSSSIGQIGANDFTFKNVKNGYDVYLTIDPVIQKQVENIANKYREQFRADSVAVLVYDPRSWHIVSSANAPSFNPNTFNDIYQLKPLSPEQAYLINDTSYIDFPIYVKTWWETRLAISSERLDTTLPKYISNNPLWPNLFIDKNIAFPYEPWSIFKAFTYGIGLDIKEIDPYDQYEDPNSEIKVWPYTIKNAEKIACMGNHSFLYALQHSCNVGMVRISQKLTQNTFYNYIEKLWFGSLTNIELAGEDPWFVESSTSVSVARFFNNVFWQGLLTTPLQIAAWYGAMLNGGQYVKPTIISKICEWGTDSCQNMKTKVIKQIFDPSISEKVKFALTKVIEIAVNGKYSDVPWYKVGGKSWTSQISYKWKYRSGNGWTNWSYVGMITEDNLKYLVVIQVRRPRSTQWWNQTAWIIFRDTASFLINYEIMKWEKFQPKKTTIDYSTVQWAESLD
jgi:cell division protein FtsI/penicillin-binding protein 2